MEINILDIARIVGGQVFGSRSKPVSEVLIDSRSRCTPENVVFFALTGPHHDGHDYIETLYQKGVRCFVIDRPVDFTKMEGIFIRVENTLDALQVLAGFCRDQYSGTLIGVTGSNGKTIVKEWAAQVLANSWSVIRSPKSYNSQVGVPLSLFLVENPFDFALIEAGISKPGEMERLEKIISPNIGLITNIGDPHQENFLNLEEKLREKLFLFKNCKTVIYCRDHDLIHKVIQSQYPKTGKSIVTWSNTHKADLTIRSLEKKASHTIMKGNYKGRDIRAVIPFTDQASVENAIHVWLLMLVLDVPVETIISGLQSLNPIAMRLEVKQGINQCTIINDIYNSDLASLEIALDFLSQLPEQQRNTLILSDILQSGHTQSDLYLKVAHLVRSRDIDRFVGIGEALFQHADKFDGDKKFYKSTEDFINHFLRNQFRNEKILLKGARQFEFEKISALLEHQVHETVLEINLNAIKENLNTYRSKLLPDTRVMVMVKAFSYGSGSVEIANTLQYQGVDMLAVAYTDEGVALREEGIGLPIMVMSPDPSSLSHIITYILEPEIYSFRILDATLDHLQKNGILDYPVHIKLDTGMNRLGFKHWEVDALIQKIKGRKEIRIHSVFSHLSVSDDPQNDAFSEKQIELFKSLKEKFRNGLPEHGPLYHILNSSGINRFPSAQFDMVRLGIGLHGYSSTGDLNLSKVSTFLSTVIQIKEARPGEAIGYGLDNPVEKNTTIAVVPVGYADGLDRKMGNGRGVVYINGNRAPITGSVCMDMCMVDVSGMNVKEGDRVEIFGPNIPVDELARMLGTIPYEILTGISRRVKRIYIQE